MAVVQSEWDKDILRPVSTDVSRFRSRLRRKRYEEKKTEKPSPGVRREPEEHREGRATDFQSAEAFWLALLAGFGKGAAFR